MGSFNFFPEAFDGFFIIPTAENGRTRHEHVHAGSGDIRYRLLIDTAVDLNQGVQVAVLKGLTQVFDFLETAWYKLLAAETRVDAHDQHVIDILQDPVKGMQGG